MSLILLDGFEDLTSWSPTGMTVGAGRNGNAATQSGTTDGLTFTVPAAQESDTVTLGFALFVNALPSLGTNRIVDFRSDAGVTDHDTLYMNSANQIVFGRQPTPTPLITHTATIVAGQWYYIEVAMKLHDTTGTVSVSVNGVTQSASSQDTKNAGTKTTIDQIRLATNSSGTLRFGFDDLYLATGTGDTFLGDLAVETLYPNGNGNANQWLGSDGDSTNNYALVNEVGTPVTTTYTGDATSGHQDLYTLTDLTRVSGSILAVCHQAYAAMSDSGPKSVKLVNRRATDTKSAGFTLATSYTPFHYLLAVDPETSAAWTVANVNALQSGVEVV